MNTSKRKEKTFFNDVVSEYSQQRTKQPVNNEEEEGKDCECFLRTDIGCALVRSLGNFRKYGEKNDHLLTHDKNDAQKEPN